MIRSKKLFVVAGLVCYAGVLFLLMVFYRLPADRLIAATVNDATKGRMIFRAEKTATGFPMLYRLFNVEYGCSLNNVVVKDRFKSMTLSPDYIRLLKGYIPVRFQGVLNRGDINGRMGVSIFQGAGEGYASAMFSDIHLEDLNILPALTDRPVKGKLNGVIEVRGDMKDVKKWEGSGTVTLQEASIGTKIDIADIKNVPFETVRLSFSLKDGILRLKDSLMQGPMFSGDIAGEVHLHEDMEKSNLNILAKMKVGSLLTENQAAGQLFSNIRKKGGQFTVKISGPMMAPSISWSRN